MGFEDYTPRTLPCLNHGDEGAVVGSRKIGYAYTVLPVSFDLVLFPVKGSIKNMK